MYLQGPISGGSLIRTSFGNRMDQLILSNPANTFTGDLDLRGGITILSGAGRLSTLSKIKVSGGATMYLSNQAEDTVTDRIGNLVPLEMRGGSFRIDRGVGATSQEQLGELRIAGGSSIVASSTEPGFDQSLQFSQLTRNRGAVVQFETGDGQRILFDQPPTLQGGMIGAWAVTDYQDANRVRRFAYATYGPQGVDAITQQSTMQLAGPTSHVNWTDDFELASNRTIYSLQNDNSRSLGNSKLTIESGGILGRGQLTGGQITVGNAAGQELVIIGGANIASTIVDNAQGPVDVTLVGGGRLSAANQHTGVTRIVGDLRSTSPTPSFLAAGAIVAGKDLEISSAAVEASNLQLGKLLIKDRGELNAPQVSAQEVEIHDGWLITTLTGNGTFRKVGSGMASLITDFKNFQGQIHVEEGLLDVDLQRPMGPVTVHPRGALRSRGSSGSLRSPVTLAGGELQIAGNGVFGQVEITAPSTLRASARQDHPSEWGLYGSLVGSAPLRITGVEGVLPVNSQSPSFSGPVDLDSVTVMTLPVDWEPARSRFTKEPCWRWAWPLRLRPKPSLGRPPCDSSAAH